MQLRKFLPILFCTLLIVGCRNFILQAITVDPPLPTTPAEPTCTYDGEIIFYQSNECFCCPGYEIVTGDQSIFVSDLGNREVEQIVQEKVWNDELPVKISFSYDAPDTHCVNHQYLTCIELK